MVGRKFGCWVHQLVDIIIITKIVVVMEAKSQCMGDRCGIFIWVEKFII